MMSGQVASQPPLPLGCDMFYNWNQWVGQNVDGKFPLLKNLGCSDHSAAFLTERRERDGLHPATIKLVPAPPESSEQQLSQWREASALSHPRLARLFESGKCELGGVQLLYVVMEHADENLASVLPERALNPDETRAMLEAVLDGLAYLHREGFVHGHIKPANIMAHGEELKISSDGLSRAGESRSTSSTPDDIWSIGMTLVEALTQRPPVLEATEPVHPMVPLTMPEPFNDIARHCLVQDPASRWTVAEIADRLKGRSPVAPTHTLAPETSSPVQPVKPAAAGPDEGDSEQYGYGVVQETVAQTRIPAPETSSPVQPVKPAAAGPDEGDSKQRGYGVAQQTDSKQRSYGVYVAAGLGLALILVAGPRLFRHRPQTPQPPAATHQQARVQPEAQTQKPKIYEQTSSNTPTPPQESVRQERNFATAGPLPAADGSKVPSLEGAKAAVAPTAKLSVVGEVLQKVLPDVPQAARESIHGTVRVTVRVDVDHAGQVEDAVLETPGPSKYFAQLALAAAQRWQFKPPKVAGQNAMSTWAVRFEFTRAETSAVPAQEIP